MRTTQPAAHFFGLTRGSPPLGEEEVGVDPETVRLVLPGPVINGGFCGQMLHHWFGLPAFSHGRLLGLGSVGAARRWSVTSPGHSGFAHRCNYNSAIVPYHIGFAQGGIQEA